MFIPQSSIESQPCEIVQDTPMLEIAEIARIATRTDDIVRLDIYCLWCLQNNYVCSLYRLYKHANPVVHRGVLYFIY